MRAQALSGRRNVLFLFRRQGKVHVNKVTQVEAGLFALHVVIGKDRLGIVFRYGIGKGFLIGEEFGALHVVKQRPEQNVRGLFLGAGRVVRIAEGGDPKQDAANRQPQCGGALRSHHGCSPKFAGQRGRCHQSPENLRRILAISRVG